MTLSPEELLAGAGLVHEVVVPAALLAPAQRVSANGTRADATGATRPEAGHDSVKLRPLTVRDLQLITRAAKDSDTLVATLMVQQSLVEPKLTLAQVSSLHAGLARFLLGEVNRISGIETTIEDLEHAASAPLVRAAFLLSQEFGWTPEQVNALTLGQVMLHLNMIGEREGVSDEP